jgi:hypothetical protein
MNTKRGERAVQVLSLVRASLFALLIVGASFWGAILWFALKSD